MNTSIELFDNRKRQKTDQQLRSEALNRYMLESRERINALSLQLSLAREEVRFARFCMGFVLFVLMIVTGYEVWRYGQ